MLFVVPFEKTSFVKAVFWKALFPNALIVEFDKFNEVKLVHPSKTLLPIVTLLAFPKLNDLRLEFLKVILFIYDIKFEFYFYIKKWKHFDASIFFDELI